jgi:hypothetical protein
MFSSTSQLQTGQIKTSFKRDSGFDSDMVSVSFSKASPLFFKKRGNQTMIAPKIILY